VKEVWVKVVRVVALVTQDERRRASVIREEEVDWIVVWVSNGDVEASTLSKKHGMTTRMETGWAVGNRYVGRRLISKKNGKRQDRGVKR
jgi:hypothetical protein